MNMVKQKITGNEHEENPYSIEAINEKYGINNVQFKTLSLVNEAADLLNNIEGRALGEKMEKSSMKEIAQVVLNHYYGIGLWEAVKMDNGNYEVQRLKLSNMRYKNAVILFNEMDENGFPPDNKYYKKE
jgi:hypothetical protein